MNKTDRLLAIVLEIQGKGRQRAEDLARTFETSKRTIYRDIEALCEAGVPLLSIPGRGYSLMEGYFLPPLSFSTDEATMLLMGSELTAQYFDAQYRSAAQSAGRKIAGVLPQQLRDEVAYLQQNIRFIPTKHEDRQEAMLQQLRRAILDRLSVEFDYFARFGSETKTNMKDGPAQHTRRVVDPYALIYANAWYLTAHDHMRNATRNFRLDRIESLTLTQERFQRPAKVVLLQDRVRDETPIIVRVLFDHAIARWVRESNFYFVTHTEETPDGLYVTLTIREEREVIHWLLSWGSAVRVLEPDSLRTHLLEEAQAMVRNFQERK
jgi:predicted DNA-binding transcriptional regulator YafY